MKKIVREPLFHFLLLGAFLFLLFHLINNSQQNSKEEIIIDTNELKGLTAKWEMQWKRQPTQEELSNLILQNVRQEVFYQEALKMNLDHNDEIIKRRLSQKMEFLSNDLANLTQPNDAELETYFQEHSEKYMLPYSYSLYQLVFTYDNHKNPVEALKTVMEVSNELSIQDLQNKGDQLPFPYHFKTTNSDALASQLGTVFSDNLENLELKKWVGPVSSGFGEHMVYITQRIAPRLPDLSSVKDLVLRDYQYEKQKEVNDAIFKTLKKNYRVSFDFDETTYAKDFKSYLENKINN